MTQLINKPQLGSPKSREVVLTGTVVFDSAGAIASQTGQKDAGFTVNATAGGTGRYTILLSRQYKVFKTCQITLMRDSTTAPSTTTGNVYLLQNNKIGDGVTTSGIIDVQFYKTSDWSANNPVASGVMNINLTVAD